MPVQGVGQVDQTWSAVRAELVDMQTREPVETLEVDAVLVAPAGAQQQAQSRAQGIETNKASYPSTTACVLVNGQPVPHLWAVGDVTGKLMLAHTAAAKAPLLSTTSSARAVRSLPQHPYGHLHPSGDKLRRPQ